MKILVANLGSTSFKYRLYDLGDPAEPLLARGAVERIGAADVGDRLRLAEGRDEVRAPSPTTATPSSSASSSSPTRISA